MCQPLAAGESDLAQRIAALAGVQRTPTGLARARRSAPRTTSTRPMRSSTCSLASRSERRLACRVGGATCFAAKLCQRWDSHMTPKLPKLGARSLFAPALASQSTSAPHLKLLRRVGKRALPINSPATPAEPACRGATDASSSLRVRPVFSREQSTAPRHRALRSRLPARRFGEVAEWNRLRRQRR